MPVSVSEAQREAYYRSALALLRHVEDRSPTQRRFGPEADALWRGFAGDLHLGDRIELLLRDADRQWPAAFGARAVFALRAAHEQDAFGADWRRPSKAEADALWRGELEGAGDDKDDPLATALERWSLEPADVELPTIGPASRLVVAGAGAIVAVLRCVLAHPDLSWSNQIAVIADAPGPRQLAAMAPALVDRPEPTILVHSGELDGARVKALRARLGAGLEPLISSDAGEAERAAAETLAGS